MDTQDYFEKTMQIFNNMSDKEFDNFINPVIEQTELIGGLTTNIRWDIIVMIYQKDDKLLEEEYQCTFFGPMKFKLVGWDKKMKYAKSKKWPDYWILKDFCELNNENFVQVCDCLISNIRADILMMMLKEL